MSAGRGSAGSRRGTVHPDLEWLAAISVKSKRSTDTWDIDTFPLTAVVRDAGSLYYSRAVVVLNKTAGKALDAGVVKPDERDWDTVMDVILQSVEMIPAPPVERPFPDGHQAVTAGAVAIWDERSIVPRLGYISPGSR